MSQTSTEPYDTSSRRDAAVRRAADQRVAKAVADFQAGVERERSFQVLFESYRRPLERFFARKGFAEDLCRDLTQETFLGIYKGLETWRPEARFGTWLFRIATTTYLKAVRSRTAGKRSGEEVSTDAEGAVVPEVSERQLAAVLDAERRAALQAAVAELPEKMRRCLVLRIYHELSYQEVAAMLQLSVETVKAHLYQARGKLKQRLNG